MKRITFLIAVVLILGVAHAEEQQKVFKPTKVQKAVYFDKSGPLKDREPIAPGERDRSWKDDIIQNEFIEPYNFDKDGDEITDPVVQRSLGRTQVLGPVQNFSGMGNLNGVYPPDTDGDVGPNHYFQMINLSFTIFDKQGNTIYGPADNSTLWDGFIGPWTGTNDGDPIIIYDEEADRWVASQFAVNGTGGKDYELVAVSVTSDPTGEYYRYAFEYDNFNDYPKLAVWRDSYVATYNMFAGGSFQGAAVAAFDREAMLAGDPDAEQQFFQLSNSFYGVLPADYDGDLPPEGSPNYLTHMKRTGSRGIQIFEFNVDWVTPANSTLEQVQTLDPGSYSTFSIDGGVPQPNTTTVLDDFIGQAMYRLAYRNFGDYEAMVMNHGVAVSSQHGLRWYELRKEADTWEIYQSSTFAPDDGLHRWMGSIAMNGNGDIALGYSVSGEEDVYPSIRYTARTADAPLGEMNVGEIEIKAGGSSQNNIDRWGDYAAMSVDPADDETFWFTNEYINAGWRTQIASFNLQPIAPPVVSAGPDTIICEGSLYNTSPATAESASSFEWTTSGDGNFAPTNTTLETNYIRGNQDIENGGAWLYVSAFGYQVGLEDQDSLYLTIMGEPEVNLGPDTTICDDQTYTADPVVKDASFVSWVTNGDGTFDNPSSVNATYTPGEQDLANGEVLLTLSAIPTAPCEETDADELLLSFTVCTDIANVESVEEITVYPNPSQGIVHVNLTGVKAEEAQISVSNTAGKVIYSSNVRVEGSSINEKIDLSSQPEGVYLVTTTVNNEVVARKVVLN